MSRSFGEAYERDGTMVIPVAWVAGGGGGGEGTSGAGGGPRGPGRGRCATETSSGSGGGFGGVVVPVGVYVVDDERVKWVPAVNANLVFLVVIVALRLVMKSRRRHAR